MYSNTDSRLNSIYSTDPSLQELIDLQNPNVNSLTNLIDIEKAYLETLTIIDSQIAPIWMRQLTSSAPDFSKVLKCIHDILKENKNFYIKLTKIATNPELIDNKLEEVLIQWIDDMESPYANYAQAFIPNLNRRTDILSSQSIRSLLKNLSDNTSYDINLECLFNTPIRQLRYYREFYTKLNQSSEPDLISCSLLADVNNRIDRILSIAEKDVYNRNSLHHNIPLNNRKSFQTPGLDPKHDLIAFENQVDCSSTVDLYEGARINYQLKLTTPGTEMVMRDSFFMLPSGNEPSVRVHLVLTTELLVISRELGPSSYSLLYPAIPIGDISVQSQSLEKEIVGEYVIQFTILGKRNILMRADSKEIRNTWVGVDPHAPSSSTLTPRSLGMAAHNMMLMKKAENKDQSANFRYTLNSFSGRDSAISTKTNHVRITDSFVAYSDISEDLLSRESSDSMVYKRDSRKDEKSSKTTFNNYNGHASNYSNKEYESFMTDKQLEETSTSLAPRSNNSLPHAPNRSQKTVSSDRPIPTASPPSQQVTPANDPVKVLSHAQVTYMEPPTLQMKNLTTSSSLENENISVESREARISLSSPFHFSNTMAQTMSSKKYHAVPAPLDRYPGHGMKSSDSKPSSPRPVELQKAVIPQAMQAVTQKTNDYLKNTSSDSQKIQTGHSSSSHRSRSPVPHHSIPHNSSARNMSNQNQSRTHMTSNQHLHPSSQHGNSRPTSPQPNYRSNPSSPQPSRSNGNPSPYPNKQHTGEKVQSPNYNKPMPSPTLSPSTSNNTAKRSPSPRMQQSPGQHYSSSPSGNLNSPPHSPNQFSSPGIQKVLFSNDRCDVFHWHNQTWYAAEGHCLLQINVAQNNRTCVAIQLQDSGQLYLNAWILPNTVIRQASATDINISLYIGTKKENYLIHFSNTNDASVFFDILQRVHQDAVNSPPVTIEKQPELEPDMEDVNNVLNVPQSLKPLMQCKCKLFLQNETGNWSTFGSVNMRISEQTPSMRMHIEIENDKGKLVSATVKSGNVEKLNSKRITFLLTDEADRKSMVYMVHLREEQTGNKIFEYLRVKNSENGW